MATYDKGQGFPILFLHGYLSCKESFNYQLDFLSKYFRVIAVDLRGFGGSSDLNYPYSLEDYANEVLKVLNVLKIRKCHIIAHSFGGRVAIKITELNPFVIDKLVLTGCAGLKPKRKPSYYFKVYFYKIFKNFMSSEQKSKFGSSEYKSLKGNLKKSYLKIVNEHLDGLTKKIQNKTLIIFGSEDTETPLYMARKLNKNIKNSTLYLIKGGSHFCFVEKPMEFNLLVKEFLI